MKLNCDLGESYGVWKMPVDDAIMPIIDQANIACGFHAGDPLAIKHALGLAKKHGVEVGAHPAYPDLSGFGRRSLAMDAKEIIAMLHYQIGALHGMAHCEDTVISFVKPHGALYNDMLSSKQVRHAVMDAIASFIPTSLTLVMQAHPDFRSFRAEANERDLDIRFEAFADRCYADNGALVSRREKHAVLDFDKALEQSEKLIEQGFVITESGNTLPLIADTLCVHGDSPDAVYMAKAIRELINRSDKTA
ncbi:5-oxoprolinase subunit PxpA [Alteromonas sp. ASW11-130]|uniref:5-oxoprolinase subunit PxpA n=1 Tax=Alteromonas sp. ASW11-130 TaxID=3015775 RepID=UPI00224190BD|nr:5-oxoprolinase subunit PxpA [Alteromonas sp. ASW11-130]MCW8092040.1 5-oxoprolinase subunit PxpA [Alteromonas sp. ASW11-130]